MPATLRPGASGPSISLMEDKLMEDKHHNCSLSDKARAADEVARLEVEAWLCEPRNVPCIPTVNALNSGAALLGIQFHASLQLQVSCNYLRMARSLRNLDLAHELRFICRGPWWCLMFLTRGEYMFRENEDRLLSLAGLQAPFSGHLRPRPLR